MKRKARAALIAELAEYVRVAREKPGPYPMTYSVLNVHFAESEGELPTTIAIPYLPYHNKTEISLPFRILPIEVKRP